MQKILNNMERLQENDPIKNLNKKKRRKIFGVTKINQTVKNTLIEMFYFKKIPLIEAARKLSMNYSSAKTIVRKYRIDQKALAEELKSNYLFIADKSTSISMSEKCNIEEEPEEALKVLSLKLLEIRQLLQQTYDQLTQNQMMMNIYLEVISSTVFVSKRKGN